MNLKIEEILKTLNENAETGNLCFSLYKKLVSQVLDLAKTQIV